MSDIIHLLPDSIANQIAAGEVIQRPASVVKELVENSIDAGATHVQVNIKDAGKTLVQVIDDGKGMSETDARMSFERHATSKIARADDLFALHTMGFRGEALASIAAVAHVELRTRLKGSELGTRLEIAGSQLQSIEADSCAEGSCFSVKNLFYNVPARRKFLKSNETEFRNILNEFERIALVNPSVAMSLYHNETEILNLPETGLRQRISNIYGKTMNQKLLSVDTESSLVSITGFVGKPETAKKRGALQYFFVNGRFMKHPYFHKAVMQAYDQLIPAGEMPSYFIYFNVDPASIDVNIHPTKTEIKFENEQPIWQILLACVREALAKSSAIPLLDFNEEKSFDIPVYNPKKNDWKGGTPKVQIDSNYNPFQTAPVSNFDWSELYKNFEADRTSILPEEGVIEKRIENRSFPSSEKTMDFTEPNKNLPFVDTVSTPPVMPCFQYKNRYIITTLKSGMAIIDQHRAHIRILFEQYQKSISQQKAASQQMLFPAMIELTPAEEAILPELMDELSYSGFDLSNLGGGSYSVNGIPASMEGVDCVTLLKEILDKALDTECKAQEDICNMIAFSLASAQAIPAGKMLSIEEMDHLLASLFLCTDINLTPDGKTILTLLSDDELESRFR